MKKIILAIAICGFAFLQTNAQNPAAVSTTKMDPTGVKSVSPTDVPQKPTPVNPSAAVKPTTKRPPKVAPASVTHHKPVMKKQGAHGKPAKQVIKDNTAPAKPVAPVENNKK